MVIYKLRTSHKHYRLWLLCFSVSVEVLFHLLDNLSAFLCYLLNFCESLEYFLGQFTVTYWVIGTLT